MENKNKAHTYAIVTLVLGIVSIALIFFGWSAIIGLGCGIVAIVFAKKTKKESSENEPMATAGFICGIIGTALSGLLMILLIITLIIGNSIFNNFGNLFFNNSDKEIKEKATDLLKDTIDVIDEKVKEQKDSDINDKVDETIDNVNNSNSSINNDKISELEEQLATKKQELSSKKSSIVDLTTRMQTAISNREIDKVSSFQKEISDLNTQIITLNSEIMDLQNKISELK